MDQALGPRPDRRPIWSTDVGPITNADGPQRIVWVDLLFSLTSWCGPTKPARRARWSGRESWSTGRSGHARWSNMLVHDALDHGTGLVQCQDALVHRTGSSTGAGPAGLVHRALDQRAWSIGRWTSGLGPHGEGQGPAEHCGIGVTASAGSSCSRATGWLRTLWANSSRSFARRSDWAADHGGFSRPPLIRSRVGRASGAIIGAVATCPRPEDLVAVSAIPGPTVRNQCVIASDQTCTGWSEMS